MLKFTLICEDPDLEGTNDFKLISSFNTDSLDTAVIYLDMFLKGSGFSYPGELGVIYDD